MSKSDTSEYWDTVSRYFNSKGAGGCFTHAKKVKCGYYHSVVTLDPTEVTCPECCKILQENPNCVERLRRQKHDSDLRRAARQRSKRLKHALKSKDPNDLILFKLNERIEKLIKLDTDTYKYLEEFNKLNTEVANLQAQLIFEEAKSE